jgi:predicted nuclease with TOPRIM domain
MQKIKYLIILALGILLTLVYLQLDDYDNISNSLLDDNIKANQTIKELKETIQVLKNKNEKLQEDIVFLYNKIDNLNLEIEYLDNLSTQKQLKLLDQNQDDPNNENIPSTQPITLENENTITGFGNTNE